MTSKHIPRSNAESPGQPLELDGNLRHQRAVQNRLLRELRRVKRESLSTAHKAEQIIGALESTPEMLAANGRQTRDALRQAQWLRNEAVSVYVRTLLGVSNDEEVYSRLRHSRFPRQAEAAAPIPESSSAAAKPSAKPTFSANAALAEALQIVAKAHDDALTIDWTQEPLSDREGNIRLEIIRRIEATHTERTATAYGDGNPASAAGSICFALEALAPADAEEYASDLTEALDRWEAIRAAEHMRETVAENQRLLDEARHRLDRLTDR